MEDEIDLRPYIELLVKRWYLIIGAAVLAGALAFVISSLLPPTYQATALVAITEPRLRVQFSPQFEQTGDETQQPFKAFPELATSDEVLLQLLEVINPGLEEVTTLDELRKIVEAQSGSDPTLVRLAAAYRDPDQAARITNLWAGLFVTRANEIFGDQGEDQEQFFIDQLADAEVELSSAEDALISFEAHNRSSIIDNELASLLQIQASYLADQREIAFLLQDIEGLHDQLNAESGGVVTFADQLTALSLQLKAFSASANIPVQLQLEATESLTTPDRDQQVAYLKTLIATLETRLDHIDETMVGLEPKMLTLQEQKQETATESVRLNRDVSVANETYMALARKVEEERITSDEIASVVKLASEAAVPEKAESRGRLLNTVVAGLLALILAVFAVATLHWWRQEGALSERPESGLIEED